MSGWDTPTYALAFRVASVKTRAQASAFITGSMVLVGLGIGPLLVGALDDHLKMQYGTDAVLVIRFSPSSQCCFCSLSATRSSQQWFRRGRETSRRRTRQAGPTAFRHLRTPSLTGFDLSSPSDIQGSFAETNKDGGARRVSQMTNELNEEM